MVITLGQQYNVGEKPTVILYTYINRHAGTPTKGKTKQKGRQNKREDKTKGKTKQYIIKQDKSNTIIETRTTEDHDDENLHNPETVQDAVIHLEVDEEQLLVPVNGLGDSRTAKIISGS